MVCCVGQQSVKELHNLHHVVVDRTLYLVWKVNPYVTREVVQRVTIANQSTPHQVFMHLERFKWTPIGPDWPLMWRIIGMDCTCPWLTAVLGNLPFGGRSKQKQQTSFQECWIKNFGAWTNWRGVDGQWHFILFGGLSGDIGWMECQPILLSSLYRPSGNGIVEKNTGL